MVLSATLASLDIEPFLHFFFFFFFFFFFLQCLLLLVLLVFMVFCIPILFLYLLLPSIIHLTYLTEISITEPSFQIGLFQVPAMSSLSIKVEVLFLVLFRLFFLR
jgi:hypothetical protein